MGWIAVDLDGTLAVYDTFKGIEHIGTPVPLMLRRVRVWLGEGRDVRIFTARVSDPEWEPRGREALDLFCWTYLGETLPATNVKDYHMDELWDDRAHRVEKNTGREYVGLS